MIKLSIIIPYYNTYEFTYKLLRELSIQKTDEVEVILIDDGCNEERLDQFDFVRITHLDKHYGASYAWNRGIDQAQGKFIAFIDSDDMIMMNYVEELIKAIDADLADEITFNWMDSTRNILVRTPRNRGIWKAIYRKEICPRFDETVYAVTDLPFQEQLRKTPHTHRFINKTLYAYNSHREGSITWNRFHKVSNKPE
jgi:glycosyltransferase involved in cell wall biosynthesis